MSQAFDRVTGLWVKFAIVAIVLGALVAVAFASYRNDPAVPPGIALEQPIPFSHKHHVGDAGLDCRYCHTTVETQASAGMPSTGICLSCHSQLYKDAPALAPLHASAQSGKPVAWQRVYDLPDFVYFNHSIHVAKGVACATCHGRVDRMPLMLRQQAIDMQWCLECHRAPMKRVGRPEDVFRMADPVPLSEPEIEQLRRLFQLQSRSRLTDCSTCHR